MPARISGPPTRTPMLPAALRRHAEHEAQQGHGGQVQAHAGKGAQHCVISE
jgi:hypothetical protein